MTARQARGHPTAKKIAKVRADAAMRSTLVLPTIKVIGHQIPTSWLEVSWECANPLPFCPIKNAWISKVGWGTPAEKAGLKKGDILLAFDDKEIGQYDTETFRTDLHRGRNVGYRLKLVIQTPGEEKRTVVIVFEQS